MNEFDIIVEDIRSYITNRLGNVLGDISLLHKLKLKRAEVIFNDDYNEYTYLSNTQATKVDIRQPLHIKELKMSLSEGNYLTVLRGARTKLFVDIRPLGKISVDNFEYDEKCVFINRDIEKNVYTITGKIEGLHKVRYKIHNIEGEFHILVCPPFVNDKEIFDVNIPLDEYEVE